MPQIPVKFVSSDNLDYSITLLVGNKRIEYFVDPDRYTHVYMRIKACLDQDWTNFAVGIATANSLSIRVISGSKPPWAREDSAPREETQVMSDSARLPSKEYSWTIIAPQAKGITYTGGRQWFKTKEDAVTFAGTIFEGEVKKTFDLCVVQCIDVVSPKPQIELLSKWS